MVLGGTGLWGVLLGGTGWYWVVLGGVGCCGRYGRWLATAAAVHLRAPADDRITLLRGSVLCVSHGLLALLIICRCIGACAACLLWRTCCSCCDFIVVDVCWSLLLLLLLLPLLCGSRMLMVL